MKRVVIQRRALRDLEDARAWYILHAPHMTSSFALAVDQGLRHLQLDSATGSPSYGFRLRVPGLRSWPLSRVPSLIFYFDSTDRLTVVRVLHQSRDIPAHLKN